MINSYILTTKELILFLYCKEKIGADKLAGDDLGLIRLMVIRVSRRFKSLYEVGRFLSLKLL